MAAKTRSHPPVSHEVEFSTKPALGVSRADRAALEKMAAERQAAEAATGETAEPDDQNEPEQEPQDEQPAEPVKRRRVRKVAAMSPRDVAAWKRARAQAVDALTNAELGSVFLVACDPVGEDPTVIVGAAGNDLTDRQRQQLAAAVTHLGLFHSGPPTIKWDG